jgi:hypothetical protein
MNESCSSAWPGIVADGWCGAGACAKGLCACDEGWAAFPMRGGDGGVGLCVLNRGTLRGLTWWTSLCALFVLLATTDKVLFRLENHSGVLRHALLISCAALQVSLLVLFESSGMAVAYPNRGVVVIEQTKALLLELTTRLVIARFSTVMRENIKHKGRAVARRSNSSSGLALFRADLEGRRARMLAWILLPPIARLLLGMALIFGFDLNERSTARIINAEWACSCITLAYHTHRVLSPLLKDLYAYRDLTKELLKERPEQAEIELTIIRSSAIKVSVIHDQLVINLNLFALVHFAALATNPLSTQLMSYFYAVTSFLSQSRPTTSHGERPHTDTPSFHSCLLALLQYLRSLWCKLCWAGCSTGKGATQSFARARSTSP